MQNDLISAWMKEHGWAPKQGDQEGVEKMLNAHFEALLYNIVSVSTVIAKLHGNKTVKSKHMADVRKYIDVTCKGKAGDTGMAQEGGMSMASDYFGYAHPNYSPVAGEGVSTEQVDFSAGVARAALGAQDGGRPVAPRLAATSQWARHFVRDIMKHHAMRMDKVATNEVMGMADIHLQCLAGDMGSSVKTLSLAKLEKVLAKKRHAVFH